MDTFQVYRSLRTVNPSPYMYFLRFTPEGPMAPAKNRSRRTVWSLPALRPELLVRVHDRKVESTGQSPGRVRAVQMRPKIFGSKTK